MKTVLITGANQGIGLEVARQLAGLGYEVYLAYRNKSKGIAAVEALKAAGLKNVHGLEMDVTDARSIRAARLSLESEIGALDILINNAGIAGEQPQTMSAGSSENLKSVFETNFFGAVQTTQELLPLLEKSDEPAIINVSSEMGSLSVQSNTRNPNRGLYDAYSCSKAALNAFTVMLANHYKNGHFRINSVTPGYTATNLNHYQGAKTPGQGAGVIVKYVTRGSDGLSGKFFNQDGEVPW